MLLSSPKQTHMNPVYGSYFADPFVWKFDNTYYAIGTGAAEAAGQTVGKIFPLLQSIDFFHWQFASNALVRPDPTLGDTFWAPAVAVVDDKFYLYYSVGHGDARHQLRVAISESPQGPYHDTGKPLLNPDLCPFAIDPHPFQDIDRSWYLFYARDFLDCANSTCAGTGLAVSPMVSMIQLHPESSTILRPRYDWQRFHSPRQMYGRTWDWHTLEGPCVHLHQSRYYCLFSGGRWETENYGVDFAVADHVLGPYSERGGEAGPRVVRTVPGHVLGPGHNSVIGGPDGETDYIVYHAWDKQMKARQMFIDKLLWTAEGPCCEGPTWGPGFDNGPAR